MTPSEAIDAGRGLAERIRLIAENAKLREEKRELVEALDWLYRNVQRRRLDESIEHARILLARVNAKEKI